MALLLLLHEAGARLLGAQDPISLGLSLARGGGALPLGALLGAMALLLALRLGLYLAAPPWLALGLLKALWPPRSGPR